MPQTTLEYLQSDRSARARMMRSRSAGRGRPSDLGRPRAPHAGRQFSRAKWSSAPKNARRGGGAPARLRRPPTRQARRPAPKTARAGRLRSFPPPPRVLPRSRSPRCRPGGWGPRAPSPPARAAALDLRRTRDSRRRARGRAPPRAGSPARPCDFSRFRRARASEAGWRPASQRASIARRRAPFARCCDDGFEIAGPGAAPRTRARDIDKRRDAPPLRPPRQYAAAVEAAVDAFIGIEHGNIARGEPPQYAVHHFTRLRDHRGIAIGGDDEAMIIENGRPDRPRRWAPHAHQRPAHVRSVGKVGGHSCAPTSARGSVIVIVVG